MQKSLSLSRLFKKLMSVIGDFEGLDPFVPNEVRYQAAPITECGAHLTAQDTALVNPLIAKCLLIGEKVSRPLS
ncbi:hypothetical protein ACLK18_20185 [Escherichia coli]